MNKAMLLSVMSLVLLPLFNSPEANAAAGFLQKDVVCPTTGFTLKLPGSRLEISDIVVSSSTAAEVLIRFSNPNFRILRVFLDANSSVVTNFEGQVESVEEQSLKLDCFGAADVVVTVTGTELF